MTIMFCTNKALTEGVASRDGQIDGSYFTYKISCYCGYRVTVGRQAFHDRADAVAAAEKMRLRKIEAVKRQLAKLEALRFE